MWAEKSYMGRNKKGASTFTVSQRESKLDCACLGDAIDEACRTAYFPYGVKLS